MVHQLFMGKAVTFMAQRRAQMVADNLANAATVGHKRKFMHTESLFPLVLEQVITEIKDPEISIGKKKRRYIEFGQSVRISNIERETKQGTLDITDRELDVAINGKGYFQIRLPDGDLGYTRAGNFKFDFERNLLSGSGHPVEPRIQVPNDAKNVIVAEDGRVFITLPDNPSPQEIGQLFLADFKSDKDLRSMGANYFKATELSGPAEIREAATDGMGQLKQRALELSSVNIIEEMLEMLLSQRIFTLGVNTINGGTELVKSTIDIPK
jgi:flagellar basal-body rod protein FlgG